MGISINSEQKTQLLVIYRLILAVIFGILYAYGGMSGTWIRRFLAPSVLCVGLCIPSFDWRILVQAPLMMLTLCLGYGGDDLWVKILRRGIFGLANGASSSAYNILRGVVLLVGIQVIMLTVLYIIVGVWNPFPSARAEETFLGTMIALLPALSIKDKTEEA